MDIGSLHGFHGKPNVNRSESDLRPDNPQKEKININGSDVICSIYYERLTWIFEKAPRTSNLITCFKETVFELRMKFL